MNKVDDATVTMAAEAEPDYNIEQDNSIRIIITRDNMLLLILHRNISWASLGLWVKLWGNHKR